MFTKIIKIIIITTLSYGLTTPAWAKKVVDIQQWKTDKGTRVYFVKAPTLPMVDIKIAFAAGSSRDGKQPGIATLTSNVLSEGTTNLNADEIAEKLDSSGARFVSSVQRDSAVLSLRSLSEKKYLTPALTTFSDILANANFPDNALQRQKNRQLVGIKKQQQNPSSLATETLYKTIFKDNPYGHSPLGTASSVKALNKKDLKRFYQRYYVASNAVIAIVGNVDRKQATQIAKTLTAGLAKGEKAPQLPSAASLTQASETVLPYPATQTNIRVGQIGVNHKNPDYFALLVGNYILGGGSLVSRLGDEVREKRGLSYAVYSRFVPMAHKGAFIISLATKKEQTLEAIDITRTTLKNFIAEGPSAAELEFAKQNLTGSFPLRLDSNRAIADQVLAMGFYQLPLNYLDTYRDKINDITKTQVRDAFKRQIKPQQMATIIVGKKT